jgi:acyl carrier protein
MKEERSKTMSMNDIERLVRSFIEENFLFREDGAELSSTQSLLDMGLIDSTGILELVAFLEAEFAFSIADAEIVPENLDSIRSITAFIAVKQTAGAVAA